MGKSMLLAGGIAIALLGAWSNVDASNCHAGAGGGREAVHPERCRNSEAVEMAECGEWHHGSMHPGRYDLSEEDLARIRSIMEEARAEIDEILASYEPAADGSGCGSPGGCAGCDRRSESDR